MEFFVVHTELLAQHLRYDLKKKQYNSAEKSFLLQFEKSNFVLLLFCFKEQ